MDAHQGPQGEPVLQNETPEVITGTFSMAVTVVQQYGWFLLLGVVGLLYLRRKYLKPRLDQWAQQREDAANKKIDPDKAQAHLEGLERARQRMQEQLNEQAAVYKLKQQEKEEKARQEKIADWERHQQGKGYRSKYRPKEEDQATPQQPKPKPKKPLRDPDYNPLMGNSSGTCFRPPRRGGASGGG